MKISKGNKNCPGCLRPNKLVELFNLYMYEDCQYCKEKANNLYEIYCIYLNETNDERAIICLKKPTDKIEDFVTVTHTDEKTIEIVEKIHKANGGKGKAMDSDKWKIKFLNIDGDEVDKWDERGRSIQILEFEGD